MNTQKMMRFASKMLIFIAICCLAACQQEEETSVNLSNIAPEDFMSNTELLHNVQSSSNSSLYNQVLGRLGASWWQWIYSIPCDRNPLLDETGAFQNRGQRGAVYFLAGSGGQTVVRNVTIPRGRFIFFPIVNYSNSYPCPDPDFKPAPGQSLEDFLTQGAQEAIDLVDFLSVELDNVALQNLTNNRGTSDLFTFRPATGLDGCLGDACLAGTRKQAVTDGYWMLLSPLSRGNHKLRIRGGVSAFNFSLDVTYNIKIQ